MALFDLLIIGCWAVFFLFILVGALFTKRTTERQSVEGRLAYGIPMVLAIVLLMNGIGGLPEQGMESRHLLISLNVTLLPVTTAVAAIGSVLVVLGLLLGLWARVTLGSNWSGSVTFKEDHKLIQKGPYALVRHPIYSAFLLMYLGTAIAAGTLGGFIGFPLLFLSCWIKLQQEESLMVKHFEETYLEYRRRVKALIPFVI
jgi:protein-S-isoprenylcysteine O-methyltransferase Ste14